MSGMFLLQGLGRCAWKYGGKYCIIIVLQSVAGSEERGIWVVFDDARGNIRIARGFD